MIIVIIKIQALFGTFHFSGSCIRPFILFPYEASHSVHKCSGENCPICHASFILPDLVVKTA